MNRPSLLSAISTLFPVFLFAQLADTTVQLEPVFVTAARQIQFSSSPSENLLDTTFLELSHIGSLGDVLTMKSGIFVKNYGPANLSTISTRGTDASHTAVLWNGFILQSPLNGVPDVSLIPVELMDDVTLESGGNTALSGGSAIGGSILMHTAASAKSGWNGMISGGFGSFDDLSGLIKLQYGNRKLSTSIRSSYDFAENDYPIILRQSQIERQKNAATRKWNFLQDNHFRIKQNQFLQTHFWYQNAVRQLPSPRFVRQENAVQTDENYRFAIDWQRNSRKRVDKMRAAYLNEKLLFFSDLIDSSLSQVQTLVFEWERDIQLFPSYLLNVGVHYTAIGANADGLGVSPSRHKPSLFASLKSHFFREKLTTVVNLRGECYSDIDAWPLAGMFGLKYHLNEHVYIHLKASHNFKAPTFNDLFWLGSGNPSLKPETGWSEDIGIQWSKKSGKFQYKSILTVFSNQVQNWIQWLPRGTVWIPENQRAVWAKGAEIHTAIQFTSDKKRIGISFEYAYTDSKVTRVKEEQQASAVGKQLPYVPYHNGHTIVFLHFGNTRIHYLQQYTGARTTTSDALEVSRMDAFQVGNLSFGHLFNGYKWHCELTFRVHNLWNSEYAVVENRPMPLRHFSGEFRFSF